MNEIIFSLSGEIDHHTAPQWRERMDSALMGARNCPVIIDMKNVSFMDSSGIGLLLGRYNRLAERGCIVQLLNVPAAADSILRISGIYGIMGKLM